jgi:hypothetical protein
VTIVVGPEVLPGVHEVRMVRGTLPPGLDAVWVRHKHAVVVSDALTLDESLNAFADALREADRLQGH